MNWIKILIIFSCFLLFLVAGQGIEETGLSQGPPAWIQNINPADYMLLENDLVEPYAIAGEIEASAKTGGYQIVTPDGKEEKNFAYFEAKEVILSQGDSEAIMSGEECRQVELNVTIYETPEIAESAYSAPKSSEEFYDFNSDTTYFSDPRLSGVGWASADILNKESSTGRPIILSLSIRYKNIIASFRPISEPSGHDLPTTRDEGDKLPALAKLWLDKITGARHKPGPVKPTPTPTSTELLTTIMHPTKAMLLMEDQVFNSAPEAPEAAAIRPHLTIQQYNAASGCIYPSLAGNNSIIFE